MILLLITVLVILVFFLLLFLLADKIIKGGDSKAVKPATEEQPEAAKSTDETPTIPAPVNLTIYNSELADDLDALLSANQQTDQTRIQIGHRTDKESNISKYVKEKNYHTFNFDDSETNTTDTEIKEFSEEEYRRAMLLSNIVDKK